MGMFCEMPPEKQIVDRNELVEALINKNGCTTEGFILF